MTAVRGILRIGSALTVLLPIPQTIPPHLIVAAKERHKCAEL
jgi:hypothetical protein